MTPQSGTRGLEKTVRECPTVCPALLALLVVVNVSQIVTMDKRDLTNLIEIPPLNECGRSWKGFC